VTAKQLVSGLLVAVALASAAGWYLWRFAPQHLPAEWRRDNPNSRDYAPAVYRWRDSSGIVQLTDTPPPSGPYETIRVDPDTNIVPDTLPRSGGN
jgi:hypothetical protein